MGKLEMQFYVRRVENSGSGITTQDKTFKSWWDWDRNADVLLNPLKRSKYVLLRCEAGDIILWNEIDFAIEDLVAQQRIIHAT